MNVIYLDLEVKALAYQLQKLIVGSWLTLIIAIPNEVKVPLVMMYIMPCVLKNHTHHHAFIT